MNKRAFCISLPLAISICWSLAACKEDRSSKPAGKEGEGEGEGVGEGEGEGEGEGGGEGEGEGGEGEGEGEGEGHGQWQCGPWEGGECPRNGVCNIIGCETEGGFCMPEIRSCSPQEQPVCGCDGQTYRNDCERAKAGVARDHLGACDARDCTPMTACPDGEICDLASCGLEARGTCIPMPTECPLEGPGVCGCDGFTYPNDCWRVAYGTGVAFDGPCEAQDCGGQGQCGPYEICDRIGCGDHPQETCLEPPEQCPRAIDPVCGCDGVNYDNDCLRQEGGARLNHPGEGGPIECGPYPGGACDQGRVCDQVGCTDEARGICVYPQQFCPYELQPVCGCDGRTYGNDCWRVQEAAALDHAGSCAPLPCGDQAEGCGEGQTCNVIGCGAEAQATCVPYPECSQEVEMVCGCNGVTYVQDCARIQQGVALKHTGSCQGDRACSSRPGEECPEGQVCNIRSCVAGSSGLCVVRPDACPDVFMPVCDCNGQVYANDCERLRSGAPLGQMTCR